MDNLDQVVSEIHRILKPGGTFSAVIGGEYVETPAMNIFLPLLDEALKSEGLSWLSGLGDKRTRNREGLHFLFAGNNFVQPIKILDFSIHFKEKPVDLMSFFMLMYDVGLLSPERQIQLGNHLLIKLETLTDQNEKMSHSMGMRQVFCQKTGEA